MIGLSALSAELQAVLMIGAVLVESISLYLGYGAVERLVVPELLESVSSS